MVSEVEERGQVSLFIHKLFHDREDKGMISRPRRVKQLGKGCKSFKSFTFLYMGICVHKKMYILYNNI